jgi:hypothetical protein
MLGKIVFLGPGLIWFPSAATGLTIWTLALLGDATWHLRLDEVAYAGFVSLWAALHWFCACMMLETWRED